MGKSQRKGPLGRSRHRLEDNIKVKLWEVACESMTCIALVQDRDSWRAIVNEVMKIWVP